MEHTLGLWHRIVLVGPCSVLYVVPAWLSVSKYQDWGNCVSSGDLLDGIGDGVHPLPRWLQMSLDEQWPLGLRRWGV